MSTHQISILALMIASLDIIVTIFVWIINEYRKKTELRLKVYDGIYPDINYLLTYPRIKREKEAKIRQYESSNTHLQKAVRDYLDSDFPGKFWNSEQFIPTEITEETSKKRYLQVVIKEAQRFEKENIKYQYSILEPEFSPVYYYEETEIENRVINVLDYVGRNLSLFGPKTRTAWTMCSMRDPNEVKLTHQKNLKMCPRYYEFNPEDFDDPYLDLIKNVSNEYRILRLGFRRKYVLKFDRLVWKTKYRFRNIGQRS